MNMDTLALIIAVYTLLGGSAIMANALSQRFGLDAFWWIVIYGLALFASYRIGLWHQAYTTKTEHHGAAI